MEMKQLTYDEIQTKAFMEASQLFVPPSAKKTAIHMHQHTHAHGIRLQVSGVALSFLLPPQM